MKKGKKIYVLEITFDDKTDKILSIQESLEMLDNDLALCPDGDDDMVGAPDVLICLSDIFDEESVALIADANIIASA